MSEAPPTDPPDATTRAFVDTYTPPSYEDPWTAIEDYRRVQKYHLEHPDDGRTAVGNALDLPPGRVRGWLKDVRPDVVRGYEVARDRDWLPFEADTTTGRGLNVLLAWIYAGGSIIESNYQALFAVGDDTERELLDRAADAAGIEITESRSDDPGRADEFRAAEHGTVLGRLFVALGAPVGEKNTDAIVVLPGYLSDAPDRVRREFVSTYLQLRAAERDDQALRTVREQRSDRYLRSLANLFRKMLDGDVTVSEKNLHISADAARSYEAWPDPLVDL